MIHLDGSLGEGGGQVLRTALTCAMLTGKSFRIDKIRAGRDAPGLKAQHLTAVRGAAAICGADVQGDQPDSRGIEFHPGDIHPGNYHVEIHTAGSAALVMQTLLLPLAHGEESSRLTVEGGTHVPWSPNYHYLIWQWLPALESMGYRMDVQMDRAGYYPRGGGKLTARIYPAVGRDRLDWQQRGKIQQIRGLSGVSGLPVKIARRQREQVIRELGSRYPLNDIRTGEIRAAGKGTFLVLQVDCKGGQACFSSLGKPGKPAEQVGQEAVNQFLEWDRTGGVVDRYLADQLLIPLAFAAGSSRIRVPEFTSHLKTNAEITSVFTGAEFHFQENTGVLTVTPSSLS